MTPRKANPFRWRYYFDELSHGDVFRVWTKPSAREVFRRWKRETGRRASLVGVTGFPFVLVFLDEDRLDGANRDAAKARLGYAITERGKPKPKAA